MRVNEDPQLIKLTKYAEQSAIQELNSSETAAVLTQTTNLQRPIKS